MEQGLERELFSEKPPNHSVIDRHVFGNDVGS